MKTSSESAQEPMLESWADMNSLFHSVQAAQIDTTESEDDLRFPDAREGSLLLQEYLVDFNRAIPLFQPEVISTYFKRCYLGELEAESFIWTAIHVVLGIAYRLRAMSLVANLRDNNLADLYLNKALEPGMNLLLTQPSLLVVQILVGIAILLQTSPRPQAMSLFVSTALRMAQNLGYNDAEIEVQTATEVVEQHSRVYWIAFWMDVNVSFATRRPPSQRLTDINLKIPGSDFENDLGSISTTNGDWIANIFALHVQNALIQVRAYDRLFSISSHRPPEQAYQNFSMTLRELEKYRSHPLFLMDPSELRRSIFQSDMVHLVILEAEYFYTKYCLHAASELGWRNRRDVSEAYILGKVAPYIADVCFADAKRILGMLQLIPNGDKAVIWVILPATVPALCVVLAQIAVDPPKDDDLTLLLQHAKSVVRLITSLAGQYPSLQLSEKGKLCQKLFDEARIGAQIATR